ncbi:MAG TPA: thioredoxin domain-containing protein [Rhabdochlamydiaceae bacterium]|nr:thioredoxin domain-containing protein [Rhabdochlamydiaceae bacterium]
MSASPHTNHLIHEKSPYLLQHAHNPVDWYPWGEEAFQLARKEDKPIFLSIGYATCHWCHVMERESFENPEIATLMNDTFVNVKVDREELPEVDSIYMEFAQAIMSSAGGWPLNVILTPELKPFFAVTYLPPKSNRGFIGIDQFTQQIKTLWKSEERTILVSQADKIVDLFKKSTKHSGEDLPTEEQIQTAAQLFFDIADPVYGGIRGEPKFPLGYQTNFLLQYSKAKKDSRALFYVELTLEMMSRGGIFDQLGGGFHRYSIDEKWQIPHFEKMLYDNALLAEAYVQAWKFTQKHHFAYVLNRLLNYILREMSHPEGGFYSGEDADSEGHEGRFYTWTIEEIQSALPESDAKIFIQFYGITPEGNFEGRNVLHIEVPVKEIAELLKVPFDVLERKIDELNQKMLERRNLRAKPFKDDKIITSWNGLMIDAFAKASFALKEPRYLEAAVKGATFIKNQLWKEGKLLRRFRDGEAKFHAVLDDYAFLIKALLSLFEIGAGTEWLQWAIQLTDVLEKDFKSSGGAFFQVEQDSSLLIRRCEFYDGAEPSGNAVHTENLLRLYQLTQVEKYLRHAEDILKAARSYIEAFPPGASYHLISLQRYLDTNSPLVVVVLDEKSSLEPEIRELLSMHFVPHASIVWKKPNDDLLMQLLPNLSKQSLIEGQTAVYICRQDHCEAPLTNKEEILKALQSL